MSFESVGYIAHSEAQYELIGKKDITKINNTNLSRLSFGIIESIISKPITIVFSQGNFNLSPLAACLIAYTKRVDVLIGKPKTVYKQTYEVEKETYFSLTFREEIKDNIVSKNNFFYKDILLCTGSINLETNDLKSIRIEVYPELGTKKYRTEYRNEILKKLHNGLCETMPKIVVTSLDSMLPPTIFGNIKMNFDKEEIELQKFQPKIIIYESINERGYDFGNILQLIDRAKDSDTKLVLHFSWPYLKGIQQFLDEISQRAYIGLFYFTKNFCKESKNNDFIPPNKVRHLSLEGNKWDTYYQKTSSSNFKVLLPIPEFQMLNADIEELSNWNWDFDQRLRDLRTYLKHENMIKSDRNILMFPPAFDSIVSPSEIKRAINSDGNWFSLSIENSFSIKKEESNAVKLFRGICKELDQGRNLSHELKEIFTPSMPTKKTLFQAYLAEFIANATLSFTNSVDKNRHENFSLVVCNLHPNLKTVSSFFGIVDELVDTFNCYSLNFNINTYSKNFNVHISVETPGMQYEVKIIEDKIIIKDSFKLLKKRLSFIKQIETSLIETENSHVFEIRTKTPVFYLQFSSFEKDQHANIQDFMPFIFYSLTINKDGTYKEHKLKRIWSSKSANKSSICYEISHKTNFSQKSIESCVDIYYRQLTDIEKVPLDVIKKSKLIIPGPIPFTTVSSNEIIITQGYNTLLLPFEEIIFFAYPGRNFTRILSHIDLYKNLISNTNSMIAKRDLSMSLEYTCKSKRIKYPDKPAIEKVLEYSCETDTPIDSFIRDELMNDETVEEEIKSDIKSIQKIWRSIVKQSGNICQTPSSTCSQQDQVSFLVSFENEDTEEISFTAGTMIRKEDNGEYVLSTVDELQEGDKIFYIQTEDRESIENYLLKLILKDEIPIEKILEPLTALNSFYRVLSTINYRDNYDPLSMRKLYWLKPEEKESLFYLIQNILYEDTLCTEKNIEQLYNSHTWSDYIPFERFTKIIGDGQKRITQKKMFLLATELGLKRYKESSFKQLCSMALRDQKHYSFYEDRNLLTIGKLLEHQGIIDDYLLINDEGKKIGSFLQMIAFSLRRVANGQTDPLNEIDISLEDKIKNCKIERILRGSN
ncbi:MAG: hypothetical protein PHW84_08960 [Methanosarcina sp.]|nr:hypothetical protein [Methanosarcina sp.]